MTKRQRDAVANLLFVVGGLIVAGGLGLAYTPLGVVALGLYLTLVALAVSHEPR
jgi:hypothetical protein